jgi:hypothetical protein
MPSLWPIDAATARCQLGTMRRLLRYEHKRQPLVSNRQFIQRVGRSGIIAIAVIVAGLAIGMAGYQAFEDMSFVDAFVNAAMILSGMGPLAPLKTDGGKIFAGLYAILSGLLIFGIAGLILAPVFHRLLHSFHVEDDEQI